MNERDVTQPVRPNGHAVAQIQELQTRLQEAEQTLFAIRNGEVDALVVGGPAGDQVFTMHGADHSFRVLVETMSEGALTVTADGTILYGNPGFTRMVGQRPGNVEGSRLADYVVAADRLMLEGLIREGLTGSSHGALRLLSAARGTVPTYFASSRMGVDGTDAVALCIVITDLTEHERNHAIVASERLARSILDQAGEVIIVCDPHGTVSRVSRQAFTLCANPLRQQFTTAFPLWVDGSEDQPEMPFPSEAAGHPLSLTAVAGGDQIVAVKGRLRRPEHDVPVLASAVALRGDADELLGFVVTITDVSQLDSAVKELEAFSYSIAHDLRSPVRAIDGLSRILLDEYAPDMAEEAQGHLRLVLDNAKRMGQLIDGLLAFSRLGRKGLSLQTVHLETIARRALAEITPEYVGRRVDVTIAELPECQADRSLLRQVFVNLLSNALKFTRKRDLTRIEIGHHAADGEQVYWVRDNGIGFDMRFADKLFGVFQRLHRAEEYEGTGVGLALVQRIVRRHGGRIWARAAPDEGATFYFTLAQHAH